jgi:hypothetical protein
MKNPSDPPDSTFQVKDRRPFDASGEERGEAPEKETAADPCCEHHHGPAAGGEPAPFEQILHHFAMPAMIFLGAIPNPETKQTEVDLPLAQRYIDLVQLLQEKTRGNLDQAEGKILEQLLFELRMIYLERAKGRTAAPKG